jgi:hypothetical protein
MRLTNYFLFENEEEDNKKRIYTPQEYFIATKETPIEQVKDALDDLNNYKDAGYGQYVTYQRQVDPSINPIIQKAFGPGGGPNMKTPANRKEWNSANTEWRLKKAKDIQSRTGLDITGWEDLSYDQLPKEATDWKVFYPQSSIEAMIPIILDITQKSDILKWVEKDGLITFPKSDNKTVPNDETLEKVLKTVMKNAGIKDFIISKRDADTEKKPKSKEKEKEVPSISSYNILKNSNGSILTVEDAEDLKDDLESKISELKPEQSDLKIKVIPSKQDPNNAILQISGFKSNKERGSIQQKVQDYLNNLSERKLKRNFQVRAGIIK